MVDKGELVIEVAWLGRGEDSDGEGFITWENFSGV